MSHTQACVYCRTPLILAVLYDRKGPVKSLLKNDTLDIDFQDRNQKTALDYAKAKNSQLVPCYSTYTLLTFTFTFSSSSSCSCCTLYYIRVAAEIVKLIEDKKEWLLQKSKPKPKNTSLFVVGPKDECECTQTVALPHCASNTIPLLTNSPSPSLTHS